MADFSLAVPTWTDGTATFPNGTTVYATPLDGSVDDAIVSVVSGGTASFTGLLPHEQYLARAAINGDVREVRFTSPAESGGGGVTSTVRSATWAGTVSVAAGTAKMRFVDAASIVSVALDSGLAPTGAALIVDVNKNGTTIFTTQANRPQIAAGSTQGTPAVPAVTSVAAGDVLTFDVDQVGSTVPGADLIVTVKVT